MGQFKKEQELKIKNKRLIKFLIMGFFAVLIIAGSVFVTIKSPGKTGIADKSNLKINSIFLSDRIKGNKESKVILIEYSDFQCPACAFYAPITKQIVEEFNDKIVFAYRHFPLNQHKNAEITAIAAEAAGRQGKFWEMHDIIFENQEEWAALPKNDAEKLLFKYAEKIGLNTEQFKNDLELKELKEKVGNDLNGGISAKVNSTPTFFLNGERVQPRSYEDFKQIILKYVQ